MSAQMTGQSGLECSAELERQAADGAKLDRRGFLKGAALGAGAAAAVAAGAIPEPAAASESASDRTKARYQETDHVKTFYRTNRL